MSLYILVCVFGLSHSNPMGIEKRYHLREMEIRLVEDIEDADQRAAELKQVCKRVFKQKADLSFIEFDRKAELEGV